MARRAIGSVVDGIKTLFDGGATSTLSDGSLLERFLNDRDSVGEAAFAAIVERHGPMVHRVCRGVLRESHDADDAFQATFLILARKAGAIRRNGSVGSWLYGVACRVALRARSARTRRAALELSAGAWSMEHQPETRDIEFQPEIHEEVDRLPTKYRSAIILCDLEGLTHDVVRPGFESRFELLTVMNTTRVRVVIELPEALASGLKSTANAKVKVDPLGLPPVEAKIARTAPVIDPIRHTMRAEIELDNADKTLRPGQSVQVTLQVGDKPGAILLPESAVLSAAPGRSRGCYRVVDGHATRTQIDTGETHDGRVEILGGLNEGDDVVVNAHQITEEGQAIRPVR